MTLYMGSLLDALWGDGAMLELETALNSAKDGVTLDEHRREDGSLRLEIQWADACAKLDCTKDEVFWGLLTTVCGRGPQGPMVELYEALVEQFAPVLAKYGVARLVATPADGPSKEAAMRFAPWVEEGDRLVWHLQV